MRRDRGLPLSPLVIRFHNRRNDLLRRWGTVLVEEELAVLADDGHGAVDAVPFGTQGIVGAGDAQPLVDQQIEGELLLVHEGAMAGGVGGIDAVGLGFEGPERVDGVAHGGELIRSARGAIGGIEEEGGAPFPTQTLEIESRPGGPWQGELGGDLTDVHLCSFLTRVIGDK